MRSAMIVVEMQHSPGHSLNVCVCVCARVTPNLLTKTIAFAMIHHLSIALSAL